MDLAGPNSKSPFYGSQSPEEEHPCSLGLILSLDWITVVITGWVLAAVSFQPVPSAWVASTCPSVLWSSARGWVSTQHSASSFHCPSLLGLPFVPSIVPLSSGCPCFVSSARCGLQRTCVEMTWTTGLTYTSLALGVGPRNLHF